MGTTLTRKQRAFVEAYQGDATAAARAAGYTGNSLSQLGYRLLRNPLVQAALAERDGKSRPVQAPVQELGLEELAARVGEVRQGQAEPIPLGVPWTPPTPQQAVIRHQVASRLARQAFWSSVMEDPTADMSDRLKASELLAKSEADFVARVSHEGAVPIIEVVDPYARPAPAPERPVEEALQ